MLYLPLVVNRFNQSLINNDVVSIVIWTKKENEISLKREHLKLLNSCQLQMHFTCIPYTISPLFSSCPVPLVIAFIGECVCFNWVCVCDLYLIPLKIVNNQIIITNDYLLFHSWNCCFSFAGTLISVRVNFSLRSICLPILLQFSLLTKMFVWGIVLQW